MKNIAIFSHGFWVRYDSKWMFLEIKETLNKLWIDCVLFNYFDLDEESQEITVSSFTQQAALLQQQIDDITKKHPEGRIIIIGHSQWCVIPWLCKLTNVYWLLMLSPFFHTEMKDILNRYTKDPWNTINFTWVSKRKRSDWTTTIIPKSYWKERFDTDIVQLYNTMATQTRMCIIYALQDQVITFKDHHRIKNAYMLNIDGKHDFEKEHRKKLIENIKIIVPTLFLS